MFWDVITGGNTSGFDFFPADVRRNVRGIPLKHYDFSSATELIFQKTLSVKKKQGQYRVYFDEIHRFCLEMR